MTRRTPIISSLPFLLTAPSSATLQEITLIVSPNDVCQQQYGPGSPITERMLCAYGDGKDACRVKKILLALKYK